MVQGTPHDIRWNVVSFVRENGAWAAYWPDLPSFRGIGATLKDAERDLFAQSARSRARAPESSPARRAPERA